MRTPSRCRMKQSRLKGPRSRAFWWHWSLEVSSWPSSRSTCSRCWSRRLVDAVSANRRNHEQAKRKNCRDWTPESRITLSYVPHCLVCAMPSAYTVRQKTKEPFFFCDWINLLIRNSLWRNVVSLLLLRVTNILNICCDGNVCCPTRLGGCWQWQ